jgi:hypothetical protein
MRTLFAAQKSKRPYKIIFDLQVGQILKVLDHRMCAPWFPVYSLHISHIPLMGLAGTTVNASRVVDIDRSHW